MHGLSRSAGRGLLPRLLVCGRLLNRHLRLPLCGYLGLTLRGRLALNGRLPLGRSPRRLMHGRPARRQVTWRRRWRRPPLRRGRAVCHHASLHSRKITSCRLPD